MAATIDQLLSVRIQCMEFALQWAATRGVVHTADDLVTVATRIEAFILKEDGPK